MSNRSVPNLEERLKHASEAKKLMLAKFKTPLVEGPAAIEKRQQRQAIAAARGAATRCCRSYRFQTPRTVNCHDGTNRGSRFLCIRQQLRPSPCRYRGSRIEFCAASALSRYPSRKSPSRIDHMPRILPSGTGMLPPSSTQETSGLRGLGRACIPARLGRP